MIAQTVRSIENSRFAEKAASLSQTNYTILGELVQPGPLRLFVDGLVLLLVILFLPKGIVSLPQRLREKREARRLRAARAG